MAATDVQVFTNDAFGTVRTIETDGKIFFCGRDVATALGYTNTSKALQDHCKGGPFRYPFAPTEERKKSDSSPRVISTG
jgi:bro family toxin-antitoxin system, toxin component